MNNYKIAIDGTAGSGKSTIAKALSKKLDIQYINTGLMYRASVYLLIKEKLIDDEIKAASFLNKCKFNYIDQETIEINGKELLFKDLMQESISQEIYKVANSLLLRPIIVKIQKGIAKNENSLIMEGRDITTVIMPNCKNKFYISAPAEIRAERRMEQLKMNKNSFKDILKKIKTRDEYDMNREMGPLKIADDSHIIDTSIKNIEETIKLILSKLK